MDEEEEEEEEVERKKKKKEKEKKNMFSCMYLVLSCSHLRNITPNTLTLNFLVEVVNTLNTMSHFSKKNS